jgi:hypothetical protein
VVEKVLVQAWITLKMEVLAVAVVAQITPLVVLVTLRLYLHLKEITAVLVQQMLEVVVEAQVLLVLLVAPVRVVMEVLEPLLQLLVRL